MIKFSKLKEINNDYYNDKQYKYGYVVNSLKDGLQHVSKETGEILETSNLNKIIKIQYIVMIYWLQRRQNLVQVNFIIKL